MPTNKKGGKTYKKVKKTTFATPPFIIADEGQQYARIVRRLGDKRFDIILQDTAKKGVGRARGALKGWKDIKSEDIVLVSSRDFRNNPEEKLIEQTYDILGYYTKEQVRKLIKSIAACFLLLEFKTPTPDTFIRLPRSPAVKYPLTTLMLRPSAWATSQV